MSADPIPIHHDNALCYVHLGERSQDLAHALDHIDLAPISFAKEDQARIGGSRKCQQARIVEVSGNNSSVIGFRDCDDFRIRGPAQPQLGRMSSIVPLAPEPGCQRGESGMSTRNRTRQLKWSNSIVSSSARKAA